MKIQDSNITINVENIEKSISFYESIGFTLIERWDNHYAQLSAPGIKIGLHPILEASSPGNSGNISIGFTAKDFISAKIELQQLGIAIAERTEEGGNFLHFNDPDGTSLYFIDPKW